MRIDWWTFTLEAVNFLILVVLLRRFLYQPVLAIIARRQGEVAQTFEDAEAARRDADTLLAGYQSKLAELEQERDTRLAEDRRAIDDERRRVLEQTQAQREELMGAVRRELDEERSQAAAELGRRAAETAVALATALLSDARVESVTELLFERACRQLQDISPRARARMTRPRDAFTIPTRAATPAAAQVVSARALTDADKERWSARLVDLLGAETAVEFTSDPALIEGVELYLGGAVVRCHWGEALRAVTQELASHDDAR
jgi:F-type H+-transporting ATPase subunit b